MCKLDGSWFQAAVLTVQNNSTTSSTNSSTNSTSSTRSDIREGVMVFTKLSTYRDFLSRTVGAFLSPAASSTATTMVATTADAPAHSTFFFFHLLVFFMCVHLFL